MQTPARAFGPASRQLRIPAAAAVRSASTSVTRWYSTPSSNPYGDRSVATVPSAPGISSANGRSSSASNAAFPLAAASAPYTRGEGDSSNAE